MAKKLLAEARANEPGITAALQTIAGEFSATMVGLEHKFKSEASLLRKLVDKAAVNAESLRQTAEDINDVLRYTFVLPFETYTEGFQEALKKLDRTGYQIPRSRIWNAWKYVGKNRDRGYRGINVTVISSQKQKFELQFHTAESYLLKTETHNLYQELRSKIVSEEREVELIARMKEAAAAIKRPKGA